MLAPGPICGPLLILFPRSEALGTPLVAGLCYHRAHLWGTSDSFPRSQALGTPPGGRGSVTTGPISGPLLILSPRSEAFGDPPGVMLPPGPFEGHFMILSPALKRWVPPKR